MAITKPHPLNRKLGKRLREVRENMLLSQGDAAGRVRVLRTSIINIEYGRQNINVVLLAKFARAYDVSMASLLVDL